MSEHNEQVALFNWARYQEKVIPELKMLYAIPNGGHRHKRTAARLKAEGVKAGVLDINLDVARGIYHAMRIEMKWNKNKPTKEQKKWIKRYTEQGFLALVFWNWEDAREAILQYLALKDGQEWKTI